MKSTFLCIVTLITCSGCVIGDLEFYPEYQRPEGPEEEWVKDPSLNPDFQRYVDEQRSAALYRQEPHNNLQYLGLNRGKQTDLTWPSVAAAHNILKNQNLARRITEITRKFEESNRKPQYYFKTHGLPKEQENRFNIFNGLEDGNANEFVPRFKPNFHILDDVRLHPDDEVNADFSLPNEDLNAEDNERVDREFSGENANAEVEDDKEENENVTESDKVNERNAKLEDDPNEFAYPPSDPRYFEETTGSDNAKKQNAKPAKNPKENDDYYSSNEGTSTIQVHNRNEGFYQEPFMGLREAGRRDDALEVIAIKPHPGDDTTGVYIIAIVAGISAAATVGLIAFGIGWYNLQKHVKNASDVEYPAYGVTGPNKDISPSGDRRLAQSAQMYHYQHQKQQIIAMERAAASERHGSVSEADSDEENEEGDYTVYECPGLAPTGEMEVKNPLFQDDPTPAQTPAMKSGEEDAQKK